jgi:hypothetical protein
LVTPLPPPFLHHPAPPVHNTPLSPAPTQRVVESGSTPAHSAPPPVAPQLVAMMTSLVERAHGGVLARWSDVRLAREVAQQLTALAVASAEVNALLAALGSLARLSRRAVWQPAPSWNRLAGAGIGGPVHRASRPLDWDAVASVAECELALRCGQRISVNWRCDAGDSTAHVPVPRVGRPLVGEGQMMAGHQCQKGGITAAAQPSKALRSACALICCVNDAACADHPNGRRPSGDVCFDLDAKGAHWRLFALDPARSACLLPHRSA